MSTEDTDSTKADMANLESLLSMMEPLVQLAKNVNIMADELEDGPVKDNIVGKTREVAKLSSDAFEEVKRRYENLEEENQ